MKIPLFSKTATKPRGRKVVRASTRAVREDEGDYYESEPNMKLSHAFMVVLILHVVAVGGIYAFNQVNAKKNSSILAGLSNRISGSSTAEVSQTKGREEKAPEVATATAEVAQTQAQVAPKVTTTAATKVESTQVVAAAKTSAAPIVTTTKTTKTDTQPAAKAETLTGDYTVAKGDNPYAIAKKLGVNYQDLLKLNKIEDPTKLQIGQVLKVPAKTN